ncbi:hypothetical protein CYMTET_20698 [Cymbomonas tetramitiformis]|uniref:Protein kinase domain-containing protein n=1 Tax=Cymbomonas tetramitiformis TaxID=36881 RepID=A0AAE0G3N7_9CHLO|nr:hypothetical protein CYMTET_20698 [Cymbomonas tetramitiformis]
MFAKGAMTWRKKYVHDFEAAPSRTSEFMTSINARLGSFKEKSLACFPGNCTRPQSPGRMDWDALQSSSPKFKPAAHLTSSVADSYGLVKMAQATPEWETEGFPTQSGRLFIKTTESGKLQLNHAEMLGTPAVLGRLEREWQEDDVIHAAQFYTLKKCTHLKSGEESVMRQVKLAMVGELAWEAVRQAVYDAAISLQTPCSLFAMTRMVYVDMAHVTIVKEKVPGQTIANLVDKWGSLHHESVAVVFRQMLVICKALHDSNLANTRFTLEHFRVPHVPAGKATFKIDAAIAQQIKCTDFGYAGRIMQQVRCREQRLPPEVKMLEAHTTHAAPELLQDD